MRCFLNIMCSLCLCFAFFQLSLLLKMSPKSYFSLPLAEALPLPPSLFSFYLIPLFPPPPPLPPHPLPIPPGKDCSELLTEYQS